MLEHKGVNSYCKRLTSTYDRNFLLCLGLVYFNNGFDTIVRLAYNYRLLEYYNLAPMEATKCIALICLPWSWKILYGFFTDSFPIMGSRKKVYLFLMAGI